jgi:hypothetical protein
LLVREDRWPLQAPGMICNTGFHSFRYAHVLVNAPEVVGHQI